MDKKEASTKPVLPSTPKYVGKRSPQPTKIIVYLYDHESYQMVEGFQEGAIRDALAMGKNVWIDIMGLADHIAIGMLCAELSIHPLVIEDILHTAQRPKLEIFDGYLFIVFQLLDKPQSQLSFDTEQFSMLVKKNLLMTIRETMTYNVVPLHKRLMAENSLIREHGNEYLTYLVIDRIINNYFHFVNDAGDALERMEDLLINNPDKINLKELYTIKRRTLTLHRTIAPIRDIVHLLLGEHEGIISYKYRLYYRDLHDHAIRLLESVDLHHQMTSGMLDIYLSTLNNRLNETMKILTLFASMFIPLTFIVGVYGMNFEYMPELKWHYAYPTLMVILALIAGAMFYYFKKKKLI